MSEDFGPNIITLSDEDGVEQEFELIDEVEVDDEVYVALVPILSDPDEMLQDDGNFVVLKVIEEENEELLVTVDDDEELERIGNIFLDRFENFLEDEEEDPEDLDS